MPLLTIEYMPTSVRYSNVRSHVSKSSWDVIRQECYQRAGYRCEICKSRGNPHPLECHEVFSYDPQTRLQSLVRLEALCPKCHTVKHLDIHEARGEDLNDALNHLRTVNGWTEDQVTEYLNLSQKAADGYRHLSGWRLDLSLITNMGHKLFRKDHAAFLAKSRGPGRQVAEDGSLPKSRHISQEGIGKLKARAERSNLVVRRRGDKTERLK